MEAELERVRAWAKDKLQGGEEPPWAWYQYMKLVETVDAILAGRRATTENSLQSGPHPATHLRLVETTCPRDSVQTHPGRTPWGPLPM
jgi:hypothetical protein